MKKALEIKENNMEMKMLAEIPLRPANSNQRSRNRQLRLLSQSVILEESASPYIIRNTMLLISGILLVFLFWAALVSVDEIAATHGEVIPSGYVQDIQHSDGGTVSEILVHEGDMVEKSQPLIKIDNLKARAELDQMKVRQVSLQLQAERLRAFIQDRAPEFSSGGISQSREQNEMDILTGMETAREQQKKILEDQIAWKRQELASLNERQKMLAYNVSNADKENKIRHQLVEKGLSSELSLLDSDRRTSSTEGEMKDNLGKIKISAGTINEAESRLKSLDSDLKGQALKELGQVESEYAELQKILGKLSQTVDNLEVKSPVRGLVKGITVTTIGGVVNPGQTLMQIVPVDQELLVETQISPRDVGHLKLGQEVVLKISSYDYSRYGTLKGRLTFISPSTFTNKEGIAYYKGKVALSQSYVGNDAERNLILPGMTVQADVITGRKTLIQYLLKPIYVAANGAFHER